MTVHTPVRMHARLWRVCKILQTNPNRIVKILAGLEHLPESLALFVCAALEEAKSGIYFIEREIEVMEPPVTAKSDSPPGGEVP